MQNQINNIKLENQKLERNLKKNYKINQQNRKLETKLIKRIKKLKRENQYLQFQE